MISVPPKLNYKSEEMKALLADCTNNILVYFSLCDVLSWDCTNRAVKCFSVFQMWSSTAESVHIIRPGC